MQHAQLLCPPLYPGFAQIHVHWVSNAIQLSYPLFPLLLLPSIFARINWNFSFSTSPSSEYSGLISFRIDWLDFLAVQWTLKSYSAPQFKSINFSELSLLYGPTLISVHDYWKNHCFVGKMTCLLFNMLSRFVIAFLPRSKHGYNHCLQSFWSPRK